MYDNIKKLVSAMGADAPSEAQIAALLSSPDASSLLALLTGDGGQALREAGESIAAGDMSKAAELLKTVCSAPGGEELLSRLGGQLK